MKVTLARCAVVPLLALIVSCGREFEGGGDLRAQRVVLEREVEGIRQIVQRLERGEALLPAGDVAIVIEDTLVRDLIGAQLPIALDVDRYHVDLREVEVQFQGSPAVRLGGQIQLRARPSVTASVQLFGALDEIQVDSDSSTLRATIAVDHLAIEEAAGIGQLLSGSTLDEVARLARLEIVKQLPTIQIPVKVQRSVDFPAMTQGPVRMTGARMALTAAVSQVMAARGRLWIAVHIDPGDVVKVADAPPAGDASASEAGVTLGDDDAAAPVARPPTRKRPVQR